MKTTADGIVIWEVKTGEADRVITILTENGLITAYARGSMKANGRLTAGTSVLSYSNFELASGKTMYTVTEAELERRFIHLYSDAQAYSLAVYFCELLKLLAPTDEDSSEYLKLMLNSLYLLDSAAKPLWQVKAVFELTLMTLSGYMPDVLCCSQCGEYESDMVTFDLNTGSWLCSSCSEKAGLMPTVPFSAVAAMRYIITSEPKKAFSFRLTDKAAEDFAALTESFVRLHVEHKLSTLDFYKQLL